jgi:hypothetical protein
VFAAEFAILVAMAIVETCVAQCCPRARSDSILLQQSNGNCRAREITAHVWQALSGP